MITRIIPFITGDGVGPEIMPVMQKVTHAAVVHAYGSDRRLEWQELPAGEKAFHEWGTPLPVSTLETLRHHGIGIKGPLTTPVGGGIRSLNVAMRQALDLFACVRPLRWFKGVASPVRHPERVNAVIFRENTEDIYAGIEWEAGSAEARKLHAFLHDELKVDGIRFPETSAYGVKPVSQEGSERLVRAACRYALAHPRSPHAPEAPEAIVTLVHKGNIMKHTEGGFKRWGYALAEREFAAELSGHRLEMNDCIADAFLQNALLMPERFHIVATLNLNGDYISDMMAAQVGGIGIAPGANINYDTGVALFEATHGTAPDIAGKDVANPCSLILSAVMMLEHMGWNQAAAIIVKALEQTLAHGYATPDLARFMPHAHPTGTRAFGEQLLAAMEARGE